jgi:hypothetical protein
MPIQLTELNQRAMTFVGELSIKATLALSSSVSATLGFLGEFARTNQWGSAGLAGVIAATVGGAFVFIPRIMEQRRKNVESFSVVRDKETTALISRMADLHKEELAFEKLRSAEANYVASLERQAKHDLLSELSGAQSHNQILVDQLRRLGHEPVIELHPVDYRKIVGHVDEEIKQMRKSAVETAKDSLLLDTAKASAS